MPNKSLSKLVFTLAIAACARNAPQAAVAPGPDSLSVEQVGSGVRYERRWYREGPELVHWLTIDPRACGIEFHTMKGGDHVLGRERTEAMARRVGEAAGRPVVAAINSDFFSYEPNGISEGPQISRGKLIKSEGTRREAIEDRIVRLQPVFALSRDGKRYLTHTHLRAFAHHRKQDVRLAGVNTQMRANLAFMYDSFFGATTDTASDVMEVVTRGGVVVDVDSAVAGVTIPSDGFVLALNGVARTTLGTIARGDTIRVDIAFDSLPGNIVEMVGGYPMLLSHGRAVHHSESGLRPSFGDRRHPRSAIGWGDDRRIHIVVVEGRRPGVSEGMTLQELGEYMRANGLHEAMNFDGGGSSTMVVNGRAVSVWNGEASERAVANGLVVLGPAAGSCK